MNLDKLRKKTSLEQLRTKVEETNKLNETDRQDDSEFWKLKPGEDGTASALIRFLPAPEDEDLPYAKYFDHYFKCDETGLYYSEKSRTTLGKFEKDPVGELNSKLWKQGEEGQKIARKQKRNERIISNILVIKDFANPENDGKVFKFRYGKKIFEKIMIAMKGDEEIGEEGFNPFSPWEGANFSLKVKKVKDFPNYDDSKFTKCTPIGDDDFIENVWKQVYPLKSYTDPETFKSYEDLKKELDRVLGNTESEAPVRKTVSAKVEKSKKTDEEPPFDISSESLTSTDLSDIDDLLKDIDLDNI